MSEEGTEKMTEQPVEELVEKTAEADGVEKTGTEVPADGTVATLHEEGSGGDVQTEQVTEEHEGTQTEEHTTTDGDPEDAGQQPATDEATDVQAGDEPIAPEDGSPHDEIVMDTPAGPAATREEREESASAEHKAKFAEEHAEPGSEG